jgi:transcriptional regulator with XRE-family HTH domain
VVARSRPRRLAETRGSAGLTQAQIAERLGVRQERVSALERGDPDACEIRSVAACVEAAGGRLEICADFGASRVVLR